MGEEEEEERRVEMVVTVLGEMALRSMKVRVRGAAVVPRRAFRAVMPAGEWQAVETRRAVAMASRDGTMLRMMSAWETSSLSSARMVILAAWIRVMVDVLEKEGVSTACAIGRR
jgi:hypothetical protein